MSDKNVVSQESDINFKALFESVPGLYLVLLPDFNIVAVSNAYADATMTKREEVTGKHLFEVFPDNPDDINADGVSNLRASLNAVLKSKTAHSMAVQKYDIRRPDGTFEERFWSAVNKPVLNSNNKVAYIIHRVEDVTEFIRLQKEKTANDKIADDLRLRSLEMETEIITRSKEIQKLNEVLEEKVIERTTQLESIAKDILDYKFALDESSIVAVTDQKGIIQHVNKNFCKISNYTEDELLGQDHRIVNSGYHSKDFIRNIWVTIANGKIWKGELKNKAKDGTFYWVDTTIVPFLNEQGKPYQYLAIRADITQRKIAEQRVIKLNEELEEKVTERTLELTQALEREKEMNEMKSRFVSMASHEFRTPLSAVLSSVSLVEKYSAPENHEKRIKHIDRIKSSVRNLTDILNDFLSLDKLGEGKVEVENETFNLPEFLHDVMEEMDGMLKKKNQIIIFNHTGDNEIIQDKKILRNVMHNLLSNAIKYSPEEKNIHLIADVNSDYVCISVQDEGIGIPVEEQKHLFDKFFRAKNAVNIQGTGLGLNIVKKYLELLNGNISFSSVPEKGTTFKVEFPRNNN